MVLTKTHMIAAGVVLLLVAVVARRGQVKPAVSLDAVREAIPTQAGSMALNHWRQAHASNLAMSPALANGSPQGNLGALL